MSSSGNPVTRQINWQLPKVCEHQPNMHAKGATHLQDVSGLIDSVQLSREQYGQHLHGRNPMVAQLVFNLSIDRLRLSTSSGQAHGSCWLSNLQEG